MFLLGIIGAILLGAAIALVIALTFKAWRNRINEKSKIRGAKKVVSAPIKGMVKASKNNLSLSQLNELEDLERKGYTHVMAATDDEGDVVGDVDLIKDTAHDSQVQQLHSQHGQDYIVVDC